MEKSIAVTILISLIAVSLYSADVISKRQMRNLEAFTKLYGYIRFFYPSDEAQTVDWDKFAVYGTRQVMEARNDRELQKTLKDLFLPIAPALQISAKLKDLQPDLALLTPRSPENWKVTCWQYSGYQNVSRDIYSSRRTNRPVSIKIDSKSEKLRNMIGFSIDSSDLNCKQYRLTFSVKALEADTLKSSLDVMDSWWNYFSEDLPVGDWVNKEYVFNRMNDATSIDVYIFLNNLKQSCLGKIRIEALYGSNWQIVYNNDYSTDEIGEMPQSLILDVFKSIENNSSYNTYKVREENGKRFLAMTSSLDGDGFSTGYVTKIFEETVPFGTFATRKLVKNLYCSFPLALYCNNSITFPPLDGTNAEWFYVDMEKVNAISTEDYNDIATRLAAIEVYWNQLQHFYPYWKNTDADWHQALRNALQETLQGGDSLDFELIFNDLQSQTKDGHRYLETPYNSKGKKPGFIAELVENKWIVTHIIRDGINLPIGSELLKINGENFKKYVNSRRHYFVSSSKQMMDKRLFFNIMYMYRDTTATFTYKTPEGKILTQDFPIREDKFVWRFPSDKKVIEYEDGIYQLNVSDIGFTDKDFQEWLPTLEKAKGIIVDWRTGGLGLDFLAHLQNVPDTLCCHDPGKYLYPDQEKAVIEMSFRPAWNIQPKAPHLNAKIVFLSNAYDGSYLESFLVHIQHYKLGTVIGEQTAGMTGNVVRSTLPGGWKAWWTGLYVEKPDGSDFQGVGAIPDIIVHPTVKGIAEGRDEILEAGLKYLKEELNLSEIPKLIKTY